jgi:hypothetical protein
MSVIRTPSRMASFTAIELSSGSLESKRDMKETEGRLATRTIIIVPIAFLSKLSCSTWPWQLISMSLRRSASEAQKVCVMMEKPLESVPAKVEI